jgi:hypothetical protein
MRNVITIVLVLLAAVAGWFARGESDRAAPSVAEAAARASKSSLPPDAVLAVRPASAARPAVPEPRVSPVRMEVMTSHDIAPIYARLAGTNPRSPEEQWLMARLMALCGRIIDPQLPRNPVANPGKVTTPEEWRAKFVDSIAADDPDREKRIAAYDATRVQGQACGELRNREFSRDEWRKLLEDSAARGELKARLDLLKDDLAEENRKKSQSGQYGMPTLSAAQLDQVKQAMAAGDPYSITTGIEVLSNAYGNLSLQDGQGQAIDIKALKAAAALMACDAGYPCGDSHPILLFACAQFDRCGASNFRDYPMYYDVSPYVSQRIAQYQGALRNVVANNDWSGFRFYSGPPALPGAVLQ